MVLIAFFLGLIVLVVLIARHRRRTVLAGRDGGRPIYSVEPPTRRVGPPGRF